MPIKHEEVSGGEGRAKAATEQKPTHPCSNQKIEATFESQFEHTHQNRKEYP
jgi:hypothetical protein